MDVEIFNQRMELNWWIMELKTLCEESNLPKEGNNWLYSSIKDDGLVVSQKEKKKKEKRKTWLLAEQLWVEEMKIPREITEQNLPSLYCRV